MKRDFTMLAAKNHPIKIMKNPNDSNGNYKNVTILMLRRDVRMHGDARMIHLYHRCIPGSWRNASLSLFFCLLWSTGRCWVGVCCPKNILPASLTSLKLWDFLLRFLSTNSIFRAESSPGHQQTGSLITDKLIKSQMMMMLNRSVEDRSINNKGSSLWTDNGEAKDGLKMMLRRCSFMM